MAQDPLVGQVIQGMCNVISSRHQAADILHRVAEEGSAGCFPSDVTSEELGRALFRIVMNAPDQDPLLALLKGYRAAEHEFLERCAGHHLP